MITLSSGAVYSALFVMNANGGQARQLTSGTPEPSRPTWTPDGRRIVYQQPDWPASGEASNNDLWSVSPRGGDAGRLTQTPGIDKTDPSFSPDGRKLAYSGRQTIFVRPIRGGRPKRLTSGIAPAWSPDGRWIAFGRWHGEVSPGEIYVVPSAGGRVRKLASFPSGR